MRWTFGRSVFSFMCCSWDSSRGTKHKIRQCFQHIRYHEGSEATLQVSNAIFLHLSCMASLADSFVNVD